MVEKRDFAGLELGLPDISIRNVEVQTYIVIVLFLGGGGLSGWVLRVRPTHAATPTGLRFGALRHLPLCPWHVRPTGGWPTCQ